MEFKTDAVLDLRGNAIFNASVRVLNEDRTLAAVFDASGAQVNNPVATDATGEFSVAVANGKYFFEISVAGKVYETRGPISFFDPMDDGAATLVFQQAGTGAVQRTAQDKLRESVSVKDFGAIGDGLFNNLQAFTDAYSAVQPGGRIRVPEGTFAGVSGALVGSKFVIWETVGQPVGGGIWNLPGSIEQGFTTRKITAIRQTVPDGDLKQSFVRTANHAGGTPGYVCTNVTVSTDAGKDNKNFEWSLLAIMNNNADAGENVAIYGQGNKLGTGPTWGGVFEVYDKTNLPDPTSGLVAMEVDVRANGTDANNNRIGIDLFAGKGVRGVANLACEAYAAIRINKLLGDENAGEFNYGIVVNSAKVAGIALRQAGRMGIDLSEGVFTDTVPNMAIRLKAGQRINFNSADPRTMRYETGATALRYATATTTLFEVADDGTLRASGNITINGTKVVGARDTGWAAMTGTANKNAVYDTATATLPQIAGRLMALQAALTTHGLIGA